MAELGTAPEAAPSVAPDAPPKPKGFGGSHHDPDKLTLRERQFIGALHLAGMNATEAVRRIGIGGKNPDVQAARYMAKPRVKKALEAELEAARAKQEVTVERLASEYAAMAFGKYEGPLLAGHKLQALDALGKWKRMFQPETQVIVPVQLNLIGGPPLEIDNGSGISAPPLAPPQSAQEACTRPNLSVPGLDKPEPKGR